MDRAYPSRINWENEPSISTPINDTNLNKMDSALYTIDGRVIDLDNNKAGKNETFNTARNGVVPKPTQADITNEKVLRADGSWVEQTGGGGGGGGHTYVDKNDDQMPQRGKAKFTGGLNLTDDSENNRTIVDDNYEIIPWTTWQGYSDAQKAQHPNCVVTGAPDCDGEVEIEFMKEAWTNPDTTSDFGTQEITLNTDGDYDFVRYEFLNGRSYSTQRKLSMDVQKGENTDLACPALNGSASYTTQYLRVVIQTSDTKVTFMDCYAQNSNGARTTNNSFCIPTKIWVYKKKLTAKIQAIARNVSTEASKCMLDENTSVADAIIKEKHYTFTKTISSSTPTGFTTDNLHQVDASSDLAGKTIIGTSFYSDYSWAIGTANVQTGYILSATWAYVAVTSVTVTFVITVYYKD